MPSDPRTIAVAAVQVRPGRLPEPWAPIPGDFWIPDLPQLLRDSWKSLNELGRAYYERVARPHRRKARAR